MRWWKHLYMGDRAMKNRPNVLRGIREGKVMPDTYVITLPESGNHILDIRPVLLLKNFLIQLILKGRDSVRFP